MSLPLTAEPPPLRTDDTGTVRVGGSRVTLDTVVYTFLEGATAEEIQMQFPSVELPAVYAAISYYLHHREEVESYLDERAELEKEMRRKVAARFDQTGLRERWIEP
jgi:uncharacterized protein (DUF433 family)